MLSKEIDRPTKPYATPDPPRLTGFWEAHFAPFCEKYFWVLALCLVGIASVRIMSSYDSLSLTNDEPTHVACGLQFLTQHIYTLDIEHPPLSRVMQALGPYLAGVRLSGKADGNTDLLAGMSNAGHIDRLIFLMRLGNLPFFLIACFVVCAWGRKFGAPVGILALALFTFLPTMLADAGLATTDMALGANVGAAFLAALFWVEKPTIWRSLLLGVCTGLACLSKFTALGYLPAAGGLALLCYLAVSWPGWDNVFKLAIRRIAPFALAVSVTALLIWAGYLFTVGSGRFHYLFTWLPAPVWFAGVKFAAHHSHDGHGAFLLGEFRWTGWWYYFPVVLAIKTPIAFLILLGLGIFVSVKKYANPAYLFPLAFSLGILLPAMQSHVDIGVRHVEPIYIAFSVIAALGVKQLMQWSRTPAVSALTVGVLVGWMVISVAVKHPDYLAYVNAFAGRAPENVVVDSNYDWGQDLRILSKTLQQRGVHQVSMSVLSGVGHEDLYESWYGLPPSTNVDVCKPSPGLNVVGPTIAKSLSWWPNAPLYYRGNHTPWYELVPPDERIGTLLVYNIPVGSTLSCR